MTNRPRGYCNQGSSTRDYPTCLHCEATVLSASQPERQPMQADIAQIISDGWKSGKGPHVVAEEILREFDVPSALAAAPAWSLTRDDMQKLHGQAHAGAMLGGDNAYQACLAIEGILARVTERAAMPAVGEEEMVLHPLSDIRELDEVVHELGIQDSGTTPAEAIRELKAEIEKLYLAAQPASPLLADEPPASVVEEVRQIAFRLSAHQQYRLAFLISENIGYSLKSNDPLAELSVNGHPLADRGGCSMSELGEYRRLVEQPMIAGYEATIASLRAEIERSQDALQQLVDYVKDGCPDDGRYYVMIEAQAALKGIKVAPPASPLRGRELAADVLKAYEQWEADLIMENKCWEGREIPQLTGELWDRMLELQAMRNRALSAFTPGTSRPDLGTGQEWRPMIIAPKDAEIIGLDSDGRIFNLRWEPDDAGENWYDVHGDQIAYPVRWMPMPKETI